MRTAMIATDELVVKWHSYGNLGGSGKQTWWDYEIKPFLRFEIEQ
jgi:hypothetical protein